MKRLVEFPSESGEPILVEVEDMGLAGETRRGLSTCAVVERAQTSFEEPWPGLRPAPAIFLAVIQRSAWRNCLKSPEGARNLAAQGTEAALFGPFWPRHTVQINAQGVVRTPFQTVSEGVFSEVQVRK